MFTADQQEMALAQRRKELRDFKLRAVEQQRDSFIRSGIDSGSDLEIEETMDTVVKAEAEERRRSKIHNVKTPVRKRKTQKPSTLPPQQQEALLAAAARPAFVRDARFTKNAKANAKKECVCAKLRRSGVSSDAAASDRSGDDSAALTRDLRLCCIPLSRCDRGWCVTPLRGCSRKRGRKGERTCGEVPYE